jgi:hypothetical protein
MALFLLIYYVFISWALHRSGFEHSEAMFTAEKIKLLFESTDNTLLTLGTTFPSLTFLSAAAFTPFGYPYAPVLSSITFACLLFYMLIIDFQRFAKNFLPRKVFVPMMFLLFLFHPGLIYTAVSGRGIAILLLFFYLLFRSLFRYYKSQTTFYLSMASIYLTCLVFCDYNFIWLLLAFFPFIVFVSLEGLKLNKDQPAIFQYYESLNNISQRRKLANRTIAIYIIVFLLPIVALFLFKMLNKAHAGDSNYFLTSQYANWHVTGNVSIGNMIASGYIDNVITEQTQLVYQVYLLLLTPLLVLVFFLFRGKLYELFTLLGPFILISIILLNVQYYITIEYLMTFLILALIGLCFYSEKKYSSRIVWPIIMATAILNIFTGILYFNRTSDEEEKKFFASLKTVKKLQDTRTGTEEYILAAYISDITDETHKILMDDAAAYRIMAHLRSLKSVIMPINNNFLTIVENPKAGAKYVCIAKTKNRLQGYTVLNEYNIKQMTERQSFKPMLMFETENWIIYKIISS